MRMKYESPPFAFRLREGVVAMTIDARLNRQGNVQRHTPGEQEKPLYSRLEQGREWRWSVSTRVRHKNPPLAVGVREGGGGWC
jgi:hypothetical protein